MQKVFVVGRTEHTQFLEALEWVRDHAALRRFADPEAAAARCRAEQPDWIVMAQARPGQISTAEVETLHRAAPLARLVSLLGTWCEGETRTGRPWPGVRRLYWYQFLAYLARSRGYPAAADDAFPRTATDADRLWKPAEPADGEGLVVVRAADHLTYVGWADALSREGFAVVRSVSFPLAEVRGVRAGLWDAERDLHACRDALESFVADVAPGPTVVLTNFPRADDRRIARRCGAASVLGKPLLVAELTSEFRRLGKLPPPLAAEKRQSVPHYVRRFQRPDASLK